MRARAPSPQRSQGWEVRENPGRFLDESFFWELRSEGARVKVNGELAQLRDPRETPEERTARVFNAPEASCFGEKLDYLQHGPHEGVCNGNLQYALRPNRVDKRAKPCDAPECCREGGTGHAEVHVPYWAREDLSNQLAMAAGLCKVRPPWTTKSIIGRQRSNPTLS